MDIVYTDCSKSTEKIEPVSSVSMLLIFCIRAHIHRHTHALTHISTRTHTHAHACIETHIELYIET